MNWMPNEAVIRLTKKKYFPAQQRALKRLGIRFTPADDGEPLVPADLSNPALARKRNEPRLDLV